MIGRYLGQRPTSSVPLARYTQGNPGACPPGNFENAYSLKCIFLDFGAKSRAFRTDFNQVKGNKVMMNWSVDSFYCINFKLTESQNDN